MLLYIPNDRLLVLVYTLEYKQASVRYNLLTEYCTLYLVQLVPLYQ